MDIIKPEQVSVIPDFSQYVIYAPIHWIISVIPSIVAFIKDILSFAVAISFPIIIASFIGIIYCVERVKMIRKQEESLYEAKVEPGFETVDSGDRVMAHRWDSATKHINSENQNDWKQAIIEADIILDDLLDKLGYRGESIGEKLKRVAKGDMQSLNEAWEAHKVRNQIAHEPSFTLTHHDAKNVIAMYRKVFEEFYYI